MNIPLLDGYFIENGRTGSYVLRKTYMGVRNGSQVECSKVISYHRYFEDAAQAFLSLYQKDKTDKDYKSLSEYVEELIRANTDAIRAIKDGHMYRYFIDTPKAFGGGNVPIGIVDLIPVGRDNAIPRKELLKRCVEHKLVADKGSESKKDRAMRKLIERARVDYTILNQSNGAGYYIATKDEIQDLQRYIRQEEKRAKSIFRNLSNAKALYEDYKAGRL